MHPLKLKLKKKDRKKKERTIAMSLSIEYLHKDTEGTDGNWLPWEQRGGRKLPTLLYVLNFELCDWISLHKS